MNISNENKSNVYRKHSEKQEGYYQFKKLYKIIQNDIKNIVISRLHNQIRILVKELEALKKENTIIKNDLIYILKRILNNKPEYNILYKSLSNNHNNSCINLKPNMNYNSSLISLNTKNSFLSAEKANTNNIQNNNYNTSRTKISLMKKADNLSNILTSDNNLKSEDKNRQLNNKIDSYLNSLYRHNFVENHFGYENNYNLNKSKGIYDELFCTQNSIYDNNKNHNSHKSMKISFDEKIEKGKYYSMKKPKYSKYFKHIKKVDHFKLNDKEKEKDNLNESINTKNKNKNKLANESIINKNGNESIRNNKGYGKKSNTKIKIIYTNRSPFIANKF